MLHRFLHNKTAVGTVSLVLIVALMGIFAPVIAPHDPYATDILNKFAHFSKEYPLGTDNLGRCILSRMVYGIRPTLGLAVLTMLGTIGLGALMGLLAGYFRGITEELIMRVVDVMLSFPSQIMVFAVVALLGINVQNVILANVFIKWAWYARMIRTGVMQYRDRNFVQFSRCVGTPERFILFRHLVPSIAADVLPLFYWYYRCFPAIWQGPERSPAPLLPSPARRGGPLFLFLAEKQFWKCSLQNSQAAAALIG